METVKLTVGGMSCMGCVNSIKKVLISLSGVQQVDVTLADGQVIVVYDSSKTSLAKMKTAIEDAGYEIKN